VTRGGWACRWRIGQNATKASGAPFAVALEKSAGQGSGDGGPPETGAATVRAGEPHAVASRAQQFAALTVTGSPPFGAQQQQEPLSHANVKISDSATANTAGFKRSSLLASSSKLAWGAIGIPMRMH